MYYTVWKLFSQFYLKLDIKPTLWEDRLTLFVGYLISKDRKSGTIRSYISAIKSILRDDGHKISEDRYLLTSLIKACKFRNDRVAVKLPIQSDLVNTILQRIDTHFTTTINNQPYLCMLYKALVATSYFGML